MSCETTDVVTRFPSIDSPRPTGFDGTSNVLAGKLLGMAISGTHAHAFVQSYVSLDNLKVLSQIPHTMPLCLYTHFLTHPSTHHCRH